MTESIHKALSAAVLRMLRPLARLLLRHGMAYGSFAELARKAYVDAAFADSEMSSKRPTISSVSAVTGLTRKETRRLRDLDEPADDSSMQRYSRAIRVISAWVNDIRFHDALGEPAVLPMEGPQGSFAALVKAYSGDIPPTAMLSVLQSSDSVAVSEAGVLLKERAYVPSATPLDKIHILGNDVGELIATIGHNLDEKSEYKYFQRKVSNVSVRADAMEVFREMSNQQSQQLLERYHEWLSSHQADSQTASGAPEVDSGYVAVGIYYLERAGEEEDLL
jgi:hypothetical protein